jgi:hypothetical protein
MGKNRRNSGQNSQTMELRDMGSLAAVAHFSKALIRRDQERLGGCADTALARVARRVRATPGTFANIVRMRVQKIRDDLRERIVAAALADIDQEIQRLEHDKRLLEAMGVSPSCDDYRAAEDALATARDCLARMRARP